ncbi:bifunctional oligoribonuclease/PAP phosphatase NrnA [Gangjinia marincola]|uniref:Bifunctional oligoribonuclease/PAP phosphatase NrnA n=1 Tax=Gangjinia marincola TaxID=578463 RepID=A0ABN1MII1_9FLAO
MTASDIAEIKQLLQTPKKIAIIPHKNPDGDAMGSTLALYQYLIQKNHDAVVVSPNDYPDFLKWLPFENKVINAEKDTESAEKIIKEADLIFTLDFNHLSRVANLQNALEKAEATFIMIDHHQSPDDYASYTYSDVSMSSTCQMVYHFLDFLGDTAMITKEMATCIYTGIVTDTGSFRFASTTSTTHHVVASLLDRGAENATIHQKIYNTNSKSRLQLLGVALNNLVVKKDYHTAYISLSQEELNQHDFKKGDTEGFVNYGLSLKGIKFALIFIENKDEGIIKISLRSIGDFDVNSFARTHFSGGGHTNAAGGKSDLSLTKTILAFEKILPHYKKELTS